MSIIKKKPKLILILTGVSFLMSGIDCFDNNLLTIGILSLIVALLNIAASFFINKHPFSIKISLLIINAIFAALSSYFYFLAGREKIQYGWAIVSIVHLIVIAIAIKKRMKSKKTDALQ
jgi:prepilin signal peptidase PulO-like enzyme (type II secretory pathway)